MRVLALTPRGYCHGVVHAIKVLKAIANDASIIKPIYVLGMLVHNEKIKDDFNDLGIITLNDTSKTRYELLDQIDKGTVVFTAHGVSDQV
ncbi:MAG: 4-hydroxy-3-methylbut-2-enyl diphosphate reductase, partial [Candidatus Izemoplasmataceae bacterium]